MNLFHHHGVHNENFLKAAIYTGLPANMKQVRETKDCLLYNHICTQLTIAELTDASIVDHGARFKLIDEKLAPFHQVLFIGISNLISSVNGFLQLLFNYSEENLEEIQAEGWLERVRGETFGELGELWPSFLSVWSQLYFQTAWSSHSISSPSP